MVVLVLCSCGNKSKPQEYKPEKDDGKIQIGLSFDTFVIERWQRDRDIFVSTAKELGAEVNVQNANGSVEEQLKQLSYFIEIGVDVIVVVPIDADSLTEVVERAHSAGISVISYDRLARNANVDAYISFDNEAVGRLMGAYLGKQLNGQDKVLMLSGPTTDANVEEVNRGFCEEMQRQGIAVADIAYMDSWTAELAYDYINENQEFVRNDVSAIMCGNDSLAAQAIVALSELRLAGQIPVAGQDADLDACQRIVEGTQYMTVYKSVGELAEQAAHLAISMAKGEELVYEYAIHDGTQEIPYIKLSPQAVTAANIDAIIIESGFHLREDVYRNCPEKLEDATSEMQGQTEEDEDSVNAGDTTTETENEN